MSELERWEGRYAPENYLFGTAPNAFLSRQGGLLPKNGRALSVCDGEARNGVWLAEQGLDVTSVDFSPRAQAKAQALAAARGVRITTLTADLSTWEWPENAFDVIAVIFAQMIPPELLFAGIRRALKPGGVLLLEGYGPKQLEYGTGGPKELERLYTPEMLRRHASGLRDVQISEYDAEIFEGDGHGGMSALVDLTARK